MFASTKKTKASSSSSSSSSLKSSSFTPATTTTMTSSSSSTSSPSPSSSSSGSKRSIELYFWNILGSSVAVLFGEECAAAACWTILVLTIRCILYCTYLEPYVPYGLIYALPVLVEVSTIACHASLPCWSFTDLLPPIVMYSLCSTFQEKLPHSLCSHCRMLFG